MTFLFLGIVVFLAALIYASDRETKHRMKLENSIDALFEQTRLGTTMFKNHDDRINSTRGLVVDNLATIGKNWATLTKEFEIMQVRQRTLEKKIIEANRTVNLVFGKPIPMQLERVPHVPIRKQTIKRGAGRGALIPENA